MKLEEILDIAMKSRRKRTCSICKSEKKTEHAFCPRCYYDLPEDYKMRIRVRLLQDYLRGFVWCYSYLRKKQLSDIAQVRQEFKRRHAALDFDDIDLRFANDPKNTRLI